MRTILCLITATMLPLTGTAQSPALLRTFNNPTPAAGDNFGAWMAALGNDRVLVGAPYDDTNGTNAGAVYLFHTNGTLLTTFTNPHPATLYPDPDFEPFGMAVTTVGSDRVVIGSPNNQKVYLFTTNGVLVTTISSPNPDDVSFGLAIAAFGNNRILIGAPKSNSHYDYYDWFGAAYLYSTNGTLLATFSNPDAPDAGGNDPVSEFGFSVAGFGHDRVLIGANGYWPGAAHLFNTNGTRLMTFTNPAPAKFDHFGHAVAAVGTDRVLVGAPHDEFATTNAGAAYLFTTNGTLLLTITNPTPAAGDFFGNRMAMLGNDRVVIGAPGDDTTGPDAGSAYVFSLNGTLLATLNNPTPATYDRFGARVAAFGNAAAIIGAPLDDAGATDAGSAYLFSIPAVPVAPSLTIQITSSNTVVISWPSPSTGYLLQQNTNGVSSLNWSNVTSGIQNDGMNQSLIVNPPVGNRFYRLMRP